MQQSLVFLIPVNKKLTVYRESKVHYFIPHESYSLLWEERTPFEPLAHRRAADFSGRRRPSQSMLLR